MTKIHLNKTISSLYQSLVVASGDRNPMPVPSRVQRYYNDIVGFEYAEAVRLMVGDREKVLLIGDGGGRDYFYLTMYGKKVISLDIAPQPVIPNLINGDAALLPFKDETFDAVVCMEVLEHLFDDFLALQGIRRVLRDDGVLVLSVPFYHDIPDHHVRVHTPKTIRRLLEAAGFGVVEFVEKGGGLASLASFFPYLFLIHGLNLLSWHLLRRTFYLEINRWYAKIDRRIGTSRWKFLHRWGSGYGVFVKCQKAIPKNFKELNMIYFADFMNK
jgi:SAM-dependent methyltransferase